MTDRIPMVRKIDGQIVLDDPDAAAAMRAVAKHNCRATLALNSEAVTRFARRLVDRGMSPDEACIVLVNVDDRHGGPLTETLMPGNGTAWDEMRRRGDVPFARGLVLREGIQEVVDFIDRESGDKMRALAGRKVCVVIDHAVAEVFEVAS